MVNTLADVCSDHSIRGCVLALNAGSSSLKFALFDGEEVPARLLWGVIDRIGTPDATITLKRTGSYKVDHAPVSAPSHASSLGYLMTRLAEAIEVVGLRATVHRVVHGGPRYAQPQIVTPGLLDELQRFSPFAPEHLPPAIDLIKALSDRFPHLPQVACFDTAFHQDLPTVARLLPIPRRYEALGIRRYGFHGLSYEFLMQELERCAGTQAANGRVILAHLGNGASLAAVRAGRCLDTSMGFTPAAGLVMGRRSGDLDPGLVAYLARTEGMSAEQFDELVNQQSGMLGISDRSSDMRELLAVEESDPRAAEAISLFCYQAKKWVGSFAAALGGLDTLVFSGGIGEHCESIRTRICAGLGFLGVELNEDFNSEHSLRISADTAKVSVYVIKTDEELLMARAAYRVLGIANPTEL